MFDLLYAQNSSQQVNPLASFLPLILIILVFYFLLVIPQQRRQKKHQEMINSLKRGDKVVTTGGIHGIISDIKETTFILKIDENTKIEIEKNSIAYKKQS